MKVYHGATSPNRLAKAREIVPELDHGYGWSPVKMTPHDDPYFLDNGAWKAFRENRVWDPSDWIDMLAELSDMPRDPDFIVLPDKVEDPRVTRERSLAWSRWLREQGVDYPTAYSVQSGMGRGNAVRYAKFELDADYIFVGGSQEWKAKTGDEWTMTAHDYGLKCHVARPDPSRLPYLQKWGVDSFDTSTFARNDDLERLRALVDQATLTDV